MISRTHFVVCGALLFFPVSAQAEDANFFAGLDVSGGWASGSSHTTNGGAAFAGGGVVGDVKFGHTVGIGGHAGYSFDTSFSAFIGYQHIAGDVSWDANFPLYGVISDFDGNAISNLITANLGYDWAFSDALAIGVSAGGGLSLNSLSKVVETDRGTGLFLSDVANHTRTSPAARIGLEIQYKVTTNIALGLNAAESYVGGFETGNTRSGNLGITSITPYRLDDVWRTNLGASVKFEF